MKIDLHMHSTASDGKLSPEELVDLAEEKGLGVIAVADHEVVVGSKRAIEYSLDKKVEVVPAIEIGADAEGLNIFDVHIVGLFVDLENEELLKLSGDLMKYREVQKREMVEKLNELGYNITFDEVKAEAGSINYGRPHIARILMRKYPEEFPRIQDVFDDLLGAGGKACVLQKRENIRETVRIIHGAGGVAILAHPMLIEELDKVVDRFIECGGDGIEVDYAYESRLDKEKSLRFIEKARKIAMEKGLIVSGGGDFHSMDEGVEIGDFGVSLEDFDRLREYWVKNRKKI